MKKKMVLNTMILMTVILLSNAEADTKSAKPNQDQSYGASSQKEAKATVESIDYKSRRVRLKSENGEKISFVASDNIKNLNQVKKGDTVIADYAEAIVFEIKKGGKAAPPTATQVSSSARPGSNPQGIVAREVTTSVLITAIDKKKPAVTFKNANGDTETFKVRYPERLEGVNVGDTVNVTYAEAIALKVVKAVK
jgi:Cu/Ag efflux protein CusF